jgi:hypothetical protein
MAELAKVIGEADSVRPDWTRRLVVAEGGEWALLVDECSGNLPVYDPGYTMAYPVAYALAEGASLLLDPARNPEVELARRRQEAKERKEEQDRERAKREEDDKRQRDAAAQAARDRTTFDGDRWDRLTDAQKLAYALALKVEARDPELARDLRELAQHKILDVPKTRWWT